MQIKRLYLSNMQKKMQWKYALVFYFYEKYAEVYKCHILHLYALPTLLMTVLVWAFEFCLCQSQQLSWTWMPACVWPDQQWTLESFDVSKLNFGKLQAWNAASSHAGLGSPESQGHDACLQPVGLPTWVHWSWCALHPVAPAAISMTVGVARYCQGPGNTKHFC